MRQAQGAIWCGAGFAGTRRLSAQQIREQSVIGVPDLKSGS
jgi:hypothetical protein